MTGAVAAVAIALQLVNVNSQGVQGDGHSIWADVSRDGLLVVFDSLARNLSSRPLQRPDDQEVYLRNRRSGRTRMVSLNSRRRVSNAWSWMPSLSPNGRYVAFCSTASNLVRPGHRARVPHTGPGLDPHTDVFVRDLRRGVTRRASSDRRGRMANAGSCFPSVADNGDVAFVSEATDLVRGYRNRFIETFVWDWSARRVRAVAASPGGGPGPGSEGAAISPDGRYVEFVTGGRLASSDTDVLGDAYLYDRRRGSAQVVSPGTLDCFHGGILGLTPHARHVLHWCGDMVRVLDRRNGRVVNATPTLDGRPPNSTVTDAGISADGRTVVFCTSASNFPRPSDGFGEWAYAWQRDSGTVTALANAGSCARTADVSADGGTALFTADMPGLVPNDVRDERQSDAFVAPLR